jgi:hypothetical protein
MRSTPHCKSSPRALSRPFVLTDKSTDEIRSEPAAVGVALALPNPKSLFISRISRALPYPIGTWYGPTHHTIPFANDMWSCTTTDPDDGLSPSPAASTSTLPNLLFIPSLCHLAIHNTWEAPSSHLPIWPFGASSTR